MKVLVIGDLHFRPELPYATALDDGRRGEWGETLKTILTLSQEVDTVVLMGDNLNTRHNNSTVIREFVEFLRGFGDKHVHILVGNHERYGVSSALDFLERMEHPFWHVYTSPTQNVDLGDGTKATFVPFMVPWMVNGKGDLVEDTTLFVNTLTPADVAFFHQGITGAKVHGTMVDLFNEMVFPQEELEKRYTKVFSGHIHQHQALSPKTQMTGSVFSMEVSEITKQVYIYDTKAGYTNAHLLPVRGIYALTDEEYARDDIPAHSIVKCTLTKKDTFDLKDVRKKLEAYDAYVLVEQYPHERRKLDIKGATIDLDLDSLLQIYAKARDLSYNTLKEGMDLLKSS